jgi:invasion protein IalB
MRRVAVGLFCVLSIAFLSAVPAASEEAKPPVTTISPWTKFCFKETCFIGRDIRTECEVLAGAVLVEQSGEAEKTLKIAMPSHVKRELGAIIVIDQSEPIHRPFDPCYPGGCSATYETGPELVDQLKHGESLAITAFDGDNSIIHRTLSLAGFAEAYDGAPTQPKLFEQVSRREIQEACARQAREKEARELRCQYLPF